MRIKVAIVGLGNCASALIQGIEYYRHSSGSHIGLMNYNVGGYTPEDIEIVAAFDVDKRKVGLDIAEAIFMPPNCTKKLVDTLPLTGVAVSMGKIFDGIAPHMSDYEDKQTFLPSSAPEANQAEVVAILKQSGAQILVNYLPVGSSQATYFYTECALAAGLAMINNIPVFIASDPVWSKKFEEKKLPLIGDDIKSQIGATIVHRTLVNLFCKRGVNILRTYQLNTGGNTDFLNMLDRNRLASKKKSKTKSVQAMFTKELDKENIHIGPSDYVPWQGDNKVCFIRIEGEIFGEVPINLELRLSVEDSPNSAGVAIDMIRCAKIALDRNIHGVIHPPSMYFCKHPPIQSNDDDAYHQLNKFINMDN